MTAITRNFQRAGRVMRSFATADGRQIRGYVHRLGLNIELAYYISRTIKFIRNPLAWMKRKSTMRAVTHDPALARAVDPDTGYGKLPAGTLPGAEVVIAAVREKLAERRDTAEWWDPFQKKVFLPSDLDDYPEVLDFVLSDEILQIACEYFGAVPVLQTVQGWWSPKNDYMQGSQLYHRDNMDWRELKFFINVSDIGDENGPFTFLPADVSDRVSRQLGDWRRAVPDEEMYTMCKPEDSRDATGPMGTCSIVDSGRCFHYGARTDKDERVLFMFGFASYYAAMSHKTAVDIDPARFRGDPLRSLVLGQH